MSSFVCCSLSVRIHGLATGRASCRRIPWLARARQFLVGTGILQESRWIWRNLVEIQEFLSRRNSCKKILQKWRKTGIFKTPPKPSSCEQITPKKRKKRNPQESCFSLFFGPKNKFLSNRNYQPKSRVCTLIVNPAVLAPQKQILLLLFLSRILLMQTHTKVQLQVLRFNNSRPLQGLCFDFFFFF